MRRTLRHNKVISTGLERAAVERMVDSLELCIVTERGL